MKLELNIGLDVQGGTNTPLTRDSKASAAMTALAQFHPNGQRLVARYTGPVGSIIESILFVELESNNLFDLTKKVYNLSAQIGQDCIAISIAGTTDGILVGPDSASWGDFDAAYFTHPLTTERKAA